METTTKYGIAGLVSLLVIFGGTMYLTQDEFVNIYVCSTTEEWGIFYGGISSTGLTAYPFKENRTQYKRCKDGIWVSLEKYAKDKGKNPLEVLQNEQVIPTEQPPVNNQFVSKLFCNGQWWDVPVNPKPYTKIVNGDSEMYFGEC